MNPPVTDCSRQKIRWHITVDLVYEAASEDSCEEGIARVRHAMQPVIDNGSGIRELYFMRLPEKI